MPKYMLIQSYSGPEGMQPLPTWAPEEIKAHIDFQIALNDELAKSGEFVDGQALAGPDLAKSVIADGTGAPKVVDGPYPESKELLAGYRIVDVENEARALAIAARISAAPGPNGAPVGQAIEVREVLTFAPTDDL